MSSSNDTATSSPWYRNLIEWIRRHGGEIHPSLVLDTVDETTASRGIRASSDIAQGQLLIRLSGKLALDGSELPVTFPAEESEASSSSGGKSSDAKSADPRIASPWLRCLSSLLIKMEGQHDDKSRSKEQLSSTTVSTSTENSDEIDFGPYLDSLPESYDTLLDVKSWPDADVNSLFAGSALGKMVKEERESNTLQQRFNMRVKPYLQHIGLWRKEDHGNTSSQFQQFKQACACVSTRGFHLQSDAVAETSATNDSAEATNSDGNYSGPYLLPFVDLLNHSTESKCTTLQRDPSNGTFMMIAERPITAGEEVTHAYGNGLTSAQLLHTFGFVEAGAAKRAADNQWSNGKIDGNSDSKYGVTPAAILATSVLSACRTVMESSFPMELCESMRKLNIPDETWDLSTKKREILDHGLISDDILVTVDNPLSDELVTLCCLPFLPDDVYDDWAEEPCLWSADILEDYFLGKLALRSLIKAIGTKMKEYTTIEPSACGLQGDDGQGMANNDDPDLKLLKRLLNPGDKGIVDGDKRRRAIYALTIRLEKKHCLQLLKKEAINLLNNLDDDGGDGSEEDDTEDGDSDIDKSGKRSGNDSAGASSFKKIKL